MQDLFFTVVGHNADDIAETVIMNGIAFRVLLYFDITWNRLAHT